MGFAMAFGFDPERGLIIEGVLVLSGEHNSGAGRAVAATHYETDIVPMCQCCGGEPYMRVFILGFLGLYCKGCFKGLPRVIQES